MKRVMPWGKFAGRKIAELDTGYLKWVAKWIANQADSGRFADLIDAIAYELEGRRLEGEYKRYKAERKAKRKRRKTTVAEIDDRNRSAARLIAGNPRRYQGIMQIWAATILARPDMRLGDPHWTKSAGSGV